MERLIDPNGQALLGFVRCSCPQECDCENPPPDDWDGQHGVFHCSELCPVHTDDPVPDELCMVHGDIEPRLCGESFLSHFGYGPIRT